MADLPPILTAHLFHELHGHLMALLRSLGPDDWHRPTVSSERTVKDIAAHLLDGSVRRLALMRDGYHPPGQPTAFASTAELTDYLHRVNAKWTAALRRVSPPVLLAWLDQTGLELAALFEGLAPFAPAVFPVAWAGESASPVWFDVAREYTEKWHHTEQIFDATERVSTITGRRLFHPCLDTFMRALPFAYRDVPAPDGAAVAGAVSGEAGGTWHLVRARGAWRLAAEGAGVASATVTMPQDTAWRVMTKRRALAETLAAFPEIVIAGDRDLGLPALGTVAVMA
jgi:hypothetical protein